MKKSGNKTKIWLKIVFIATGIASTIWFLIRVIPKPQRATYPCMQAAAPIASSFVIYLLSISATYFSFRKLRKYASQRRYVYASATIFVLIISISISITQNPSRVSSVERTTVLENPNTPMGNAIGIHPGRVVWVYNEDATNKECTNVYGDGYFLDKNTDQVVVDKMLTDAMLTLTGEHGIESCWDTLFKYHNVKRGKGSVGYDNSEVVFIKLNATSAWDANINMDDFSRTDNKNYAISETSPQLVLSVLRQLVNVVGVPQNRIYIGDPMKHIYQENYEKWSSEFPNIHYLDNSHTYDGREIAITSNTAKINYSDRGTVLRTGSWQDARDGDPVHTDNLYAIFEDMEYLINIPTMKGHVRAGVTMFAKNHFGSQTRESAMHLHAGLIEMKSNEVYRTDYGMYRVQVDLMGHKLLGEKNLFYLMDALYCADFEIDQPTRWQKAPWSNDWTSSIFISQDPVAIESVGFDFLYYEYDGTNNTNDYPHYGAVDDYLHQAADQNNWPQLINYDPENDGINISSLGVHEHWNNPTDMQYSRNLKTGNGIELVKLYGEIQTSMMEMGEVAKFKIYPNPSTGIINLQFESTEQETISVSVYSMMGRLVHSNSFSILNNHPYKIDLSDLPAGNYTIKVRDNKRTESQKILIIRPS